MFIAFAGKAALTGMQDNAPFVLVLVDGDNTLVRGNWHHLLIC